MGKRIDFAGKVFGQLTVAAEVEPMRRGNGSPIRRFSCRCSCGNDTLVTGQNLRSGEVASCGCRMGALKHGHKRAHVGTATYNTWTAMRSRCSAPRHTAYARYGGKGVTVCAEWADPVTGFAQFLADMGPRPEGRTLDRKDNSLGYSKDNCRWATSDEQYANKKVVRDASGRFVK